MNDRCEIGSYGKDPQCDRRGTYATFVRSRHDGTVRQIDRVCGGHRARILDLKKALYLSFGLPVPGMWCEKVKGD